MGRKQKRQSTKSYATKLEQSQRSNGSSNASGIVPEPEKCLEQIDESSEKAVIESSDAKESNRIFGLGDKAQIDFSLGVEHRLPLGFDCSDCLDFQSDLARSALKFYQCRHKDSKVFELLKVLGACFLNSWLRMPSSRFRSTDKCHISFSAIHKNYGYDGDSPTWFFAELIEVDGEFRPTRCEVLETLVHNAARPQFCGITYGCDMCPEDKKFPHPPQKVSNISLKHPERVSSRQEAVRFKHHHRPIKTLSGLEAAKIALGYNDMEHVYEVKQVVFLERMPFFWLETEGTNMWYHVGFIATAKTSNTTFSDAFSRHLFGELKYSQREKKFVPTCCSTLEETSDSAITFGCGFCPPHELFFHPAGQYRCGDWGDPPPLEFSD